MILSPIAIACRAFKPKKCQHSIIYFCRYNKAILLQKNEQSKSYHTTHQHKHIQKKYANGFFFHEIYRKMQWMSLNHLFNFDKKRDDALRKSYWWQNRDSCLLKVERSLNKSTSLNFLTLKHLFYNLIWYHSMLNSLTHIHILFR